MNLHKAVDLSNCIQEGWNWAVYSQSRLTVWHSWRPPHLSIVQIRWPRELNTCKQHCCAVCTVLPTCLLFMTAKNIQTENFSDLYLPLAFPAYFLSPEMMKSLLDCELHLSTLAQLHAQNATHPLLIIVYWTISNRCDCVLYCSDYHVYVLYFILLVLYWNLAVFS